MQQSEALKMTRKGKKTLESLRPTLLPPRKTPLLRRFPPKPCRRHRSPLLCHRPSWRFSHEAFTSISRSRNKTVPALPPPYPSIHEG